MAICTNERLHEQTPEKAREKIRLLQRELNHIQMFLFEKGLSDEANHYVVSHMDEPTPFEDEW